MVDGIWMPTWTKIRQQHQQRELFARPLILIVRLGCLLTATIHSFSAFLETSGRPLIDLSLFASSQNYNAVTRPLLSSSRLPWGLGLSVSRRLRNEARLRSAHLDISYLDVDDSDAVRETDTSTSRHLTSLLPRVLNMTSVEQAQQAQKIRLDALTCSFLEPLQNLLGFNTSLISKSGPSSVDCVAFGYLALIYRPELPQPWLRDRMRSSFAPLTRYVEYLQPLLPDASAAPDTKLDQSRVLERPQVSQSGGPQRPSWILLALGSALRAMPLVRSYLIDARFAKAFTDTSSANRLAATALSVSTLADGKPLSLVTITIGLCLTWLLLVRSSASILPRRGHPNQMNLNELGQAGATLAFLPQLPGASGL